MKKFNVTGLCVPEKHYMADISEKITAITKLIDNEMYFCINCARQYGKTTALNLLEKRLINSDYIPISICFQSISDNVFEDETKFCKEFMDLCSMYFKRKKSQEIEIWKDTDVCNFNTLGKYLSKICANKKYVLMIDEIDKSSNNRIFMKFLDLLRSKYLLRAAGEDFTFHSVILVGVYNIKNLKVKITQSGETQLQDGEERINSPWNIAADFKVDMSLSINEITSMLNDYEKEHNTGMDIDKIANEIRAYTNGYPYIVSRICQAIDEDLNKDWTIAGVERAIKLMTKERSTLIDDISKNLANNKELDNLIFNIIAIGKKYKYNSLDIIIDIGLTFGFLIKQNDDIVIGNKYFEILFYIHYSQKLEFERQIPRKTISSDVIYNNKLNMQLVIEKFSRYYFEIYKNSLKHFLEDECRILFLTYLQPLINGTGFYHVESQTRNERRMDIVVDYGTDQFIIELKLWYGDSSHEKAIEQLTEYLNSKNKDTGYLITFDFRKENNTGEPKLQWLDYKGKRIFDVIVGI